MGSSPQPKPPGLTELAEAVGKYATRAKRATGEQAAAMRRGAGGIVVSVTAAVAISQLVQNIWQTGASVVDRARAEVDERLKRHDDSSTAHAQQLGRIDEQAHWCRATVEGLEREVRELRSVVLELRERERPRRVRERRE